MCLSVENELFHSQFSPIFISSHPLSHTHFLSLRKHPRNRLNNDPLPTFPTKRVTVSVFPQSRALNRTSYLLLLMPLDWALTYLAQRPHDRRNDCLLLCGDGIIIWQVGLCDARSAHAERARHRGKRRDHAVLHILDTQHTCWWCWWCIDVAASGVAPLFEWLPETYARDCEVCILFWSIRTHTIKKSKLIRFAGSSSYVVHFVDMWCRISSLAMRCFIFLHASGRIALGGTFD